MVGRERWSEVNPAIVYSGAGRDNGTAFYTRVALANVLQADPEWFTEEDKIPEGFPFLIHPDDGREDLSVEGIPHPWGYWIVDSHLGPEIRIKKALEADIVWCAQKPFVEELFKYGVDAHWLPLACEPEMHKAAPRTPDKDIVFVGHLQPPNLTNRIEFLNLLFKSVENPWFESGIFHEEMSNAYARARIGVNHAVRDDLNMRFFELSSIGVPQLADRRMVGFRDLGFEEWVHFLPYSSTEEAIQVVRDNLSADLSTMARDAQHLVRANHTYTHRVRQMLADAKDRGFL